MATELAIDESKCERRTMINLTKEQHAWIRKEAFTHQVSMSEVVRRALVSLMGGDKAKTG
jgi:hypothetical protein